MSTLPSLIIVAGRPGAGKSTLARKLAQSIHCPLISRDEIKEGVVNTTGDKGEPGGKLAHDVYDTFFETIEFLLGRNVTLVAEAAFQHKRWAPKLELLKDLAHIRLVLCKIDPQLAYERAQARSEANPSWDTFHNKILEQGTGKEYPHYDPPRLDLLLFEVDTSEQYQPTYDKVLAFAREKLNVPSHA